MFEWVARIGRGSLGFFSHIGLSGRFLFEVLFSKSNFRRLGPSLSLQLHRIGLLSCLIIVISGVFIGFVVGLQGYHTLEKFGASSQLGQLLALSVSRELGPVISALLFAGRAGSSLTAEIGLMKTTEQLASMDMMGVNPLNRIIFPRFIAGLIALPILNLIFSAVAVYSGYYIGVYWFGIDGGSFWANMQSSVNFSQDVVGGMIKSVVFAFTVIWIALYQGFICEETAEGISQATTKSVVWASIGVLGMDFVLTTMMIGGW